MSRPLFCAPRHGLPLRFFFNVPSFSFPGRRPLPSGRGGPSPVAPGLRADSPEEKQNLFHAAGSAAFSGSFKDFDPLA
jgi:hypothetical protein